VFVSKSKPINQKRDAIRLLRADHYSDNEFFLDLLVGILETQKELSPEKISKLNLKVYDDGSPKDVKLVDYMSNKLNLDKKELLQSFK